MKNLLFLLLFLTTEIIAQQPIVFERYYSDSGVVEGKAIQQTFDGGYIVAGRRNGAGMFSNDAILMKTDSMGNVEWLKVYATSLSDDEFYDVKQTSDSGFIACGYYPQLAIMDNIYVVKTDKFGDTLWTKVYGSGLADYAHSIVQTYDGGYTLAGRWSDSTGIIMRLDSQGDTLWTRHLYDESGILLTSIVQTADSGFVATGVIAAYIQGDGHQVYIARVDKNGALLWEKNYGYAGADWGQMIKRTIDGNYIVCGYTQNFDFGDMYLLKIDEVGDTIWTKVYRKTEANNTYSIDLLNDGGFILGGTTNFAIQGNFTNLWMVKTDSIGDVEWDKVILSGTADYGGIVKATEDGGYVICGMTNKNSPIIQLYVGKTDENGVFTTVTVVENTKNDLNIWPNPFSDLIFIDLSYFLQFEPYQVNLYNMLGQKILSYTFEGGTIHQIPIQSLPQGKYILQISDKTKTIKSILLNHF